MAATDRPACAALLALGLSACAAGDRADEGLYVEDAGMPFGFSQTGGAISDSSGGADGPSDSGSGPSGQGGAGAGLRACANVATFSARVRPRFTLDCVRCHDGTKGKATKLLNLTALRSGGDQVACDATLGTTDAESPALSTIFTFVDPDNPATVHDFKYATSMAFAAYRADVLSWLETE